MKTLRLICAFFLPFILISACKKIPVIPENKTKALMGKRWKMTAYTEDGVNKMTETYDACELDNIEIYAAGGKYMMDEGATKCNDDDEQIQEGGKWEIKNDKLILSHEALDIQLQFTILELTTTTLKFSLRNPFGSELYVYTYTAQ